MARMIDYYINRYSIYKTPRLSLVAVGNTAVNFESMKLLDDASQLAENYKSAKRIIDKYHRDYINRMLSHNIPFDIKSYSDLYYKTNKSDKDKKELLSIESKFRKQIADRLKSDKNYDKLFKKELFSELLPGYVHTDEYKKIIDSFDDFVTYFSGFFKNRKNMYSDEAKSTAIAYRCINENLPRFLDNCRSFSRIRTALDDEKLKEYNETVYVLHGINLEEVFSLDNFPSFLSQSGIDKYNQIIGGYRNSDGSKEKGLNEIINLYNQKVEKKERLPKLKNLYKQILGDKETVSEVFNDDNEVINAVKAEYDRLNPLLKEFKNDFGSLLDYDVDQIFIKSEYLSSISQMMTGDWSIILDQWNKEYDALYPKKAKTEKYYDTRKNVYKSHVFSINEIQNLINNHFDKVDDNPVSIIVTEKLMEALNSLISNVRSSYDNAESLLTTTYSSEKKLAKNDAAIKQIKELLDSIKKLERFVKRFMECEKEGTKDERFYGNITPVYDALREYGKLYDKVRNYVTRKPYSTDKIKLNFQSSHFLSGWAKDWTTKGAIILERKGLYYIAIVENTLSSTDRNRLKKLTSDTAIRYVYQYQKQDCMNFPRVFIRSKGDIFAPIVRENGLPVNDILDIYDNKKFCTEYKKVNPKEYNESLIKMIDYYKLGMSMHESFRSFDLNWKESIDYKDINEFYIDAIASCYMLQEERIDYQALLDLVDEGKIYLFQIYNKDFSEYSKGTPNMHTLYFKMLFDERNLKNIVYKLNGEAEMFYRFPSLELEETAVHKANQPVKNKNELSGKKTSVFGYDLVKDRRFTKPQFSLHVSITLNFKSQGLERCNEDVRRSLRECKDNYVIGIDRGERNLLYVCVINGMGEIVEQYSLNEIVNEYNGMAYKTDYHKLLDKKEKERDKARKNWSSIEGIKELKEGYISQVIHKICDLVVKYDAVIAMEDLNMGFKNSRSKVEKQVYQKFEKMLIDKLNYLVVDKKADPETNGGLLKAYQLTEKFKSFEKMGRQNGFIFYIPAWLTSKIDPVTGFVDLLKPRYESVERTKAMIESFDFARYNSDEDLFEFGLDYDKVERGSTSFIKKWTVCTNGERIRSFRNKDKNSKWDTETVVLSDAFKNLFDQYDIDIHKDLKDQILGQKETEFFRQFTLLLRLTLQMRNSIPNSDTDYLISPVRSKNGKFYCSDDYKGNNAALPENADANGAYNIARKAQWCIEQIKACDEDKLNKVRLAITNKEWLEYTQKG